MDEHPPESTEITALLDAWGAGDAAALQRLYQDTASQLFGVLKRILVRADLAEEALQDVYVSIWRNAKDYRASKGAVFTWMTSIAPFGSAAGAKNPSSSPRGPANRMSSPAVAGDPLLRR